MASDSHRKWPPILVNVAGISHIVAGDSHENGRLTRSLSNIRAMSGGYRNLARTFENDHGEAVI
jgi:hypothetical protein